MLKTFRVSDLKDDADIFRHLRNYHARFNIIIRTIHHSSIGV